MNRKPPSTFQPRIETLEDRTLMATGCTLSLAFPKDEAWENGRRSTWVYVTRKGDKSTLVTVRLSSQDISTTANKDYDARPLNRTLTFRPGECRVYFKFPVKNDGQTERDERLQLKLSNPTGRARIGRATQEILIKDNDSPLLLWDATFTGNAHPMTSDDGAKTYADKHWLDNNRDGDAGQPGDHRYPVAYTRGSRMSMDARFYRVYSNLNPNDRSRLPDRTLIRAYGPTGLTINNAPATLSDNGEAMTMADGAAVNPFEDAATVWDNYTLYWKYSYDNGKTWMAGGTSDNQLYLTAGDPVGDVTLFHTVVDLGSRNAKGLKDPAAVVAAVWKEFQDRQVSRVETHGAMSYYGSWNTHNVTTAALLKMGDSQCGGWAHLFQDTLRAQGISTSRLVEVHPPGWAAIGPNNTRLLVNNVEFVGAGTIPSQKYGGYVYQVGLDAHLKRSIAGQGGTTPPQEFIQHYLIEVEGKLYDPSYGTGPFGSQQEWENASIAGFSRLVTDDAGHQVLVARKNDPSKAETIFVYR